MLGDLAKETAKDVSNEYRSTFLRVAKKEKLSMTKLAKRLNESLDAEEVKVFCQEGYVVTSKPMIAHRVRLDALKLAGDWFGLKAVEKKEETVSGNITVEIVKFCEGE